jgi:hypothetical protein
LWGRLPTCPTTGGLWLPMIASGMLGGVLGAQGVAWMHCRAMPLPKADHHPMVRIVIDRTTSDAPLGIGPYAKDSSGYAQLERWIARLGYYTIRLSGEDVFSGDTVVIICPHQAAPASFREGLKRYVENGGKLLIFDSPENNASTANDLLNPFGLAVRREQPWKGILTLSGTWPNVAVEPAWEITGGTPVARFGDRAVAAEVNFGKGKVMAVGFASLFNDANMGTNCLDPPTPEQLERYETLYPLVRRLVEGKPIEAPSAPAGPSGKSKLRGRLPDLPLPPSHPQPAEELPGGEYGPQGEKPKNTDGN